MNSGFNDLFKTACNIKSTYINQDKKKFNSLPDFYKSGLYLYEMTKNIRKQSFFLKKCAFENLKKLGTSQIKDNNYEDAHYIFSKSLAIFKYITSDNPKWKTDGGIKDEELTYHQDFGADNQEKKEIYSMMISSLLNISLCSLYTENFIEVRQACEEVLKLDNKVIKA